MPGLTFEGARDVILDLFKTRWDADSAAVVGGAVPELEYQNVDAGASPLSDGNVPWARVTVRHVTGAQRSMGGLGNRVFQRRGVVTVQVFVPTGKQGLVLADRLGKVASDAFEGEETATGSVWFRNVSYREVGIFGPWFQVNVTAEFEYDSVK